jgi:hypothetical protein
MHPRERKASMLRGFSETARDLFALSGGATALVGSAVMGRCFSGDS